MIFMTLQQKMKKFSEAFVDAAPNLYHFWRPQKMFPCIVWQENGANPEFADNRTCEQAITGTLDYFTKEEFDPTVDQIQEVFNRLGVCWALNSIQWEDATGLIHYEWTWEI